MKYSDAIKAMLLATINQMAADPRNMLSIPERISLEIEK